MIERGMLVKSKLHIEPAAGPYCVVFVLNDETCICVSLDGNFSVNLPKGTAQPIIIADKVYELMKQKAEDY